MKRTSIAVICFNQKLLFFQRDNILNIPDPDKWQFPGGHIEESETPDQGIRRELFEEVSYVPAQLDYLGALKNQFQETHVYWSYITNEEAQKFKLGSDEGQAIKFMSIDEALKQNLTDNIKYYLSTFQSLLSKNFKNKTIPNPLEFGIKNMLNWFMPADKTPPLVKLEVTNPITYLKLWWDKIVGNEGIDFRFKIRPLTALAIAAVFAVGGFSVGRFALPVGSPLIKYIPQLAPSSSPDPWRDTAYSGVLRKTNEGKFYLQTGDGQAVTLLVPGNVLLDKYIGKRIFASGKYNRETEVLYVTDATDLEVLPSQIIPIPTSSPSPTPTPLQ